MTPRGTCAPNSGRVRLPSAGIALEEPNTWWKPLTNITDEVKAANLADHVASGSRDGGARTDAYFDDAGQNLLAGLLLAAALDKRPMTDACRWVNQPHDDTPVYIVNAHDFPLTADEVSGVINARPPWPSGACPE